MASSGSVPSFRQDKVPYRVIDVDATLSSSEGRFRFCQADSISDFCVISHMWNKYVTKLMTEIASTAEELKLSYPKAVTEKNWADDHHVPETREAYLSIKKFLEILQLQGVKKVWMDMLCIDQSEDSKEKSREIPLMGPYYRHSSACYVPINGFGFSYELRMGKIMTECVPWLNRVWTLQELLLPEKMYFLVELERWMEEWLALRVAAAGENLSHFCSCCHEESEFMLETFVDISGKVNSKGVSCKVEKIREVKLDHICAHCGSPPLLQKATQEQDCKLYLIQREALPAVICLSRFHERVRQNLWEETSEEEAERFDETFPFLGRYNWLLEVMHGRSRSLWFHTSGILNEVCQRQCTKERDSLLGVLGLLGVAAATNNQQDQADDQVQIVPGEVAIDALETPEEQLVQLACSGAFSEQLLVELCGMNQHSGRFMPKMSWIPDLTYRFPYKDRLNTLHRNNGNEFQSLATNVSVSPQGPITLTVKVLKGYVTFESSNALAWTARFSEQDSRRRSRRRGSRRQSYGLEFQPASYHSKEFDQDVFVYRNQFHPSKVRRFNREHRDIIIDREARSFGGENGTVELTFDEYGSFLLSFKDLNCFHGFEMWLLYLGHRFDGMGIVLLCLHKRGDGNVVHKIGNLDVSYMGVRKVLDGLEDPPQEITIAGYGKYLDDHVDSVRHH